MAAKGKTSKKGKAGGETLSPRIVNRRAHHDYHISEKLETGIQLLGTEVKSVRLGRVSLEEGYARIDPRRLELYLHGVHIAPYQAASAEVNAVTGGHEPTRPRKLLARKREILRLQGFAEAKGNTLVPLEIYFVRGRAKVLVGVGTGKKAHDKRETIKKRESDREIQRHLTRKRI